MPHTNRNKQRSSPLQLLRLRPPAAPPPASGCSTSGLRPPAAPPPAIKLRFRN
ncbi:hypothetical protein HanXRQr2_Chr05g0201261 [Helianthus annuus]|uniref:Uncharacterized protein n=1 Tax=Helianthus annuus TaxID=4232 RepID=A0A9K3IX09_HELAN|nr:hypothetical protein HanXRQr2_Chr05g0201261 [Helianthus annuus]KAJ0569368.1 hypothetical protein HanHA300_Chr05g0165371 [Helianthus annuus]KAJ0583678.1 hypothetical protein HanHA89_Chr05g0179421 [Helianthus annuus]KAJ0749406.1 hypothetical protein HanLR1_Chr05g0169491 [Helianthus annuus]KAJ0921659.1 hypothetical protein HanPSC8_Chr05g0194151 [Helianthus annuus]